METKTVMGYPITSIPIQEIQFEAKNAILVNLVDINVLMLLWANLSRHLDRCILRMLRRVISFHLLVNRVRLHAVLVTIKHPTLNLPVMLLMQATMFLAQPNRARLLVLLEPLAARHGSSSCTDAPAGYIVSSAGQTSATACSPGYYQASSGQTSCDAADAGYYVSSSAQSSQTACAAGTFSSTTIDDAPAGYIVSSAGQTSATACSPGYYQASSGQTSCDAADAGYYVSGTAQTSQTACAAGTYQASTGQSSCGRC